MKALITGITGQDGYFLSQYLLKKGYEVHGLVRRNSNMTRGTFDLLPRNIQEQINIDYGDIMDESYIYNLIKKEKFDELYHLAAQSFVAYSFENPASTYDINIGGTLNIVNAIKDGNPDTRIYFAATSELFGKPETYPQNEDTPLNPQSPYSISKLAGYWTCKDYRNAYKLFISNGILFNHESEVRGPEFVTRKISLHVAKVSLGSNDVLELGNLNAVKDWGYAGDYVIAMNKILKYDIPDDFVIGTGESHTVRDFVNEAYKTIGINLQWVGSGINEVGLYRDKTMARVNKKFYRPLESDNYRADYSKAKKKLNWEPKIKFDKLVKLMVEADINKLKK